MDFGLGEKAEQVRREIRAFLDTEFNEEDREQERRSGDGHNWRLYRKLAAAGWVSAGWPREYGGGGRDPYEMLALYWELSKAEFPWFGLLYNAFIGHTLMAMGTTQQKTELVPRIAAGQILVALGYSEPGSGSDVAGARTTARWCEGQWVIDGQKMFTTVGHLSQYIFTLARTNTAVGKHKGLTLFMVPTDHAGVSIYPIHTLGGERTNAVYFDGVGIPDSARVGEVDQGWAVLRFALGLEQAMGYADRQEAFLETAEKWAQTPDSLGQRPLDRGAVRERLGRMSIHAEVAKLLRYRSTWAQAEHCETAAMGPMTKAFSASTFLHDAQAWMAILGSAGTLEHGQPSAPADGYFAEIFRATPVTTIYGGTVEILRSMIAQAMGLPRSR